MNYGLLADDMLVKLLKADDEAAFREIYHRYWKDLFNAAYFRIGSKEVAKELVQGLFLAIWEKRHTLTVVYLEKYLQTAIKNRVINYIESTLVQEKHQQQIREIYYHRSADGPQEVIQYNELYNAFKKALLQLPPKARNIFEMSRFERLSAREIAGRLNISEKAVEYHITSSLRMLRNSLKDFLVNGILVAAACQLWCT